MMSAKSRVIDTNLGLESRCTHETRLAPEITNVTVQACNLFASVPHLIRVMLSPPHKMDILQAPGKTKKLGGSVIGALERLGRRAQPKMRPVSRYHPLLVTLHWLLAVLIIATLAVGFFLLAATPNSDPQKISVLRVHMAVGMLILALMVIRFIVRTLTVRPEKATTGYPLLDRIAPITHYGFYVLVLLMVGSGFTTAILAGLPAIVFGGSGAPLPSTFMIFPSFVAHGWLAALLAGFIVLHVLAAFYHQFVRRDRLFARMFYGRRASTV